MSYSKFQKEAGAYSKWRRKNNLPYLSSAEVDEYVRGQWIEQRRFKELISFVLENWEAGNCDDFIPPLVDALLNQKESAHYKRLWKGIIRHRIDRLWRYCDKTVDWKEIEKVNHADFNMYHHESYQDKPKVIAFHRAFALAAIDQFHTGLISLKETSEISTLLALREQVSQLEKPKVKTTTDKRKIDEQLFWELIEEARAESSDQYQFLDKLRDKLEAFHAREIKKFYKHFWTKYELLNSWDLWALAYIVRGGCGDDEFDYFKAWAISKGTKTFNHLLNLEVEELVEVFDEDPQLEEFMYLAETVFESKTGDYIGNVRIKQQKMKGKQWAEEELDDKYPKFIELFESNKTATNKT